MTFIRIMMIGIILTCITQTIQAQKNFIPGNIIYHDNQVISGFIDFKEWELTPHQILFKKTMESEVETLLPSSINEFQVHNEIYKSAVISHEVTYYDLNKLKSDSTIHLKTDTLFLQSILEGSKSLYVYVSTIGNENFYIREGNQFTWLVHKKYLKNEFLMENTRYKFQLAEYLNECFSIIDIINHTTYERASLRKVFNTYYKCTNTKTVYQKKKETARLKFGAFAGASLSGVRLRASYFKDINNTRLDQSINPVLGAHLQIILPRVRGRWIVHNELMYTSFMIHGNSQTYYNSPESHQEVYVDLGFSSFKLNNSLRYVFLMKKFSLFTFGGISNGYGHSLANKKTTKTTLLNQETSVETDAIPIIRKYERSYFTGIGTSYKRFSLEFRHERGVGISNYMDISASTRRTYLLLGITF